MQGPLELHTETVTVALSRQAAYTYSGGCRVVERRADCSHVHGTDPDVVGYIVTRSAQSQMNEQARRPGNMSIE